MTTVTGPRSAQPVDVPAPIRRVREVAVFRNRFGTLFNDDVVAPSGAAGQYLRWQWNQDGVVVVPVGSAGYALVPSYRYPVHAGLSSSRGAASRATRNSPRPPLASCARRQA
ncbi:hypothetical protein ALMP_00040 [Streptomyces sp. A012304]|nr:hypothetical protein ALMP_00040 [Streptomyces sp. A012304]